MRNFTSRAFAGLALGLVLLACGDDDDSSIGSGPITDASMSAFSDKYCQKVQQCTSDLLVQVAYGTIETCQARVKQQLQLDVKGSGYGVTDAAANQCLTALDPVGCEDLLNGNTPAACRFKGSLADGSNCTADAQCLSGSCFIDDAATCGKCGPRAAKGADCTNANCDYGLKCNATKLCTDGSVGAACTKDSDCRTFVYCRNAVCTAPLAENAACVVRPGPNDAPCDLKQGLFCLPKDNLLSPNGVCTKATVTFAANNEKCGLKSILPPEVIACTNGDCIKDVCVAHIADGAACTGVDGAAKCEGPATCRAGVCSLKDSNVCK